MSRTVANTIWTALPALARSMPSDAKRASSSPLSVKAWWAHGYVANDGATHRFIYGDLAQMATSRPHVRAYRVERHGTNAVETALPATFRG